jgi:hydroxyquinol 1,2-dioxygenase
LDDSSTQWITDAVLGSLENAGDARTREISDSLVRHLHAFIRQVRPSLREWEQSIAFLTAVGQTCTSLRQEFILLSDTLGASMLVDAINAPNDPRATQSTVLGPFYVEDPPSFDSGAAIGPGLPGVQLFVEGRVIDTAGNACSGAVIDTWQSDGEGRYDVQRDDTTRYLRGRFTTDESGNFSFWSIMPSSYPIPDDGPVGAMLRAQGRHPYRPAHVHFRLSCSNFQPLTTHIFVGGDPYLDSDAVFGVKESLIEDLMLHDPSEAPLTHHVDAPFAWLRRDFVLVPRA